MNKIRDIKDREANPKTVKVVEDLLRDVKSGDVRSVIFIAGHDNDSVSHGWSLDSRNTRRRMLSEVVLLQHDFTVNIEFEENDTILARAFEVE